MPVDPKYLKSAKPNDAPGTFEVPEHILKYLVERGVNYSEVCRTALTTKIELDITDRRREPLVRRQFRAPKALLQACKSKGINVSDTCREALEQLYAQIKGEVRTKLK